MNAVADDNLVTEVSPTQAAGPRPMSLVADIVTISLSQFLVLAALFANYAIIRRNWGINDLGSYSLLMRMRGLLEWIVTLQLAIAIPRQVAIVSGRRDGPSPAAVIGTGVGLGLALLTLFGLAISLFPVVAASLLFGNPSMSTWVEPFALLLGGYGACLLVSSAARGLMLFRVSSGLQIVYSALLPMALLIALRFLPLRQVVVFTGSAALVTALVCLALVCRTFVPAHASWRYNRDTGGRIAKDLLAYGAPRLVTVTCTAFYMALLPWVISREAVAPLLVAVNALLSLLAAIAASLNPIGIVLLPHLSKLLSEGRADTARRHVRMLLDFILTAGPALSLLLIALLRPLIRVWLGSQVASYSGLILAFAFALPGTLALEMLRNPIDAFSARPWNAASYGCGAVTVAAIYFVGHGALRLPLATAAAAAFAIGCLAAAAMSLRVATRLYDVPIGRTVGGTLPLFALLAAVCLAVRLLASNDLIVAAVGLASFAAYAGVVVRRRPDWLSLLMSRLPGRSAVGAR